MIEGGGTPDLLHLLPAVRRTALLSDAQRIARIRADRWIGYPRAQEALKRLEDLLTHPRRQRMPNLLIVGPTNNGKSMIVEKFRRSHTSAPTIGTDHERLPVVVVQMPSEPTVGRFYTMLLAATGAPLRPRARVAETEQQALEVLRRVGTRMLIIDEMHNILAGPGSTQREFLNLIRFLGNALHVPIVGIGTREAYLAIRSDDQLENRFEPLVLPLWRDDDILLALLASFAAVLPLRRPSELHHPEVARYVLAKTEGTIGEIATLLMRAAITAIESGEEALNPRSLAAADYDSPTERRRAFEREIA